MHYQYKPMHDLSPKPFHEVMLFDEKNQDDPIELVSTFQRKIRDGVEYDVPMCDAFATSYIIDPSYVTKIVKAPAKMSLNGQYTYGQLLIQWPENELAKLLDDEFPDFEIKIVTKCDP